MPRLRPVLDTLLGLLLLVQAIGVASANGSISIAGHAAADPMEMPCHGDGHPSGILDPPSCCDADCPTMTTCALGHFTLGSTPIVAFGPAMPPRDSTRSIWPAAGVRPSLLRPPIPWLHL